MQNTDVADEEFQRIKQQAMEDKKNVLAIEGCKEANRKKNRYKDILPYDHTRVVLPKNKFVDGSDYINANNIMDANSKVCYIASQGPMLNTVDDFWRMIWHNEVKLIIMACKEVELGKPRCQRYWPYGDDVVQFEDITVSMDSEKTFAQNMKMRKMKVSKGNKERLVTQLHYMDWPDHGAPETSETILHLISIAREINPEDDPPILIHCSAGCGRTGAIIAIDTARKLIQKRAKTINVYDIVSWLRKQRPSMVQTKDQYEFIYEVIREMVTSELIKYDPNFEDDSNPTYVNIGFLPIGTSCSNNEVFEEPKSEEKHTSLLKQEDKENNSNCTRRQILLPTEHGDTTNKSFRRNRSLYSKSSPRMDHKIPALPRKESDSKSGTRPKGMLIDFNEQPKFPAAVQKQTMQENLGKQPRNNVKPKPLLPPYKPAVTKTSTESYANVTPVSPGMKPNEEFIAAPKPTAINSYPMKPKTCNPTVPMKPNILQNKNTPMLPANGMSNSDASRVNNLHTENGKINVSHNAQNKTSNNIPAPLYTSVDKSYLSHSSKVCSAKDIDFRNPVPKGKIIPPYAVTEIGTYGQKQKKPAEEQSKVTKNQWKLSIQSQSAEAPLPERTPESYIIVEDDTDSTELSHVETASAHPVLMHQSDIASQPILSQQRAVPQQAVMYPQQSPPEERPAPSSQRAITLYNAISKMKNIAKKPMMRLPSTDDSYPSNEALKQSTDIVNELQSIAFPRRINQKVKGARPQPFEWPKFPS